MPPKKKIKSRAERTVENFFPLDPTEVKRTIEKAVSEFQQIEKPLQTTEKMVSEQPIIETIEKVARKNIREKKIGESKKSSGFARNKGVKNNVVNNIRSKASNVREKLQFHPKEIKLKEGGYELIITEKPQAALKISSALGKSIKGNISGIPYYDVDRDGEKIMVACAVGHLFTLSQNNSKTKNDFPTFDISWTPNFLVRKRDFTKKYYDALIKLVREAGSITVATDYDIEGEVIGLNVVRYICGQKDANRMKFSTLTDKELNEAYENKSPTLNWGQAIAGETRHYLDWFYGINLSRALMNAIKSTGRFRIMSIGRVQGPALNLIVKKEREIQAFQSQRYWQIFINIKDLKNKHIELELKYNKDLFHKEELDKITELLTKGKILGAETKKSEQTLPPNPPFNLTSLQLEAYKFHGITPSRTLQLAQSLYLGGLISYPRTSSEKLPASISYKEILDILAKKYNVQGLIKRNTPIEGKKSDPAHPSIYPTGQMQIISGEEEKIYNLIIKRFLSLFCEDAIIDNKTISARLKDNPEFVFSTKGSSIRKKAWLDIYPSKIIEKEIPDLNGECELIKSRTEEKQTQPPRRYSPASIVSELEKRNLGTKATRANILETLYDRGYIKEKSIEATPLGMSLITTLEKYSPIIIDEKLTRQFEREMDSIVESKKDLDKKESRVIEEAKETITKISEDFSKKEKQIGEELIQANDDLRELEKKANIIMPCPKCKKGNLAVTYSKKNRRYFMACDAYPECKNTFSLPPNGLIKKSDKICPQCNYPLLVRLSKGRRPWEFCFNPECKTNKERLEEYHRKKNEENKQEE